MTPAIKIATKAGIVFRIHDYEHDPNAESYGEEAAIKLGINPERVFKTLVTMSDSKQFFVALVPVNTSLNIKQLAKATSQKKITMASQQDAERITGYVVGGVSPLGQKKRLTTVIDSSALNYDTIYVSAGRRGLEIELAPDDLAGITQAQFHPVKKE